VPAESVVAKTQSSYLQEIQVFLEATSLQILHTTLHEKHETGEQFKKAPKHKPIKLPKKTGGLSKKKFFSLLCTTSSINDW